MHCKCLRCRLLKQNSTRLTHFLRTFILNTFLLKCFPVPCSSCRVPHKDCVVCQAYYKVFGKDFLKHRFTTNNHKRTTSTPAYNSFASEPPRARARVPQDEPLYQSRAYSAPLSRVRRRRIFSSDEEPVRKLSSSDDDIHERVDRLISRYSPTLVSLLFYVILGRKILVGYWELILNFCMKY